jgi:hypothetical protein
MVDDAFDDNNNSSSSSSNNNNERHISMGILVMALQKL